MAFETPFVPRELSYFTLNLTLSVGMKAECRQFAVQTHHIDPHNYGFKMTFSLEIHHISHMI